MIKEYKSPCGTLLIGSKDGRILLCDWAVNYRHKKLITECSLSILSADRELIHNTITQLDEYFSRQRTAFDLHIGLSGTEFQKSVLCELTKLPYGIRCSYQNIADRIGRAKSVRAVANAIASNPVSILIPCHRVIRTDNSMGGYAGGAEAKKYLLELEAQIG